MIKPGKHLTIGLGMKSITGSRKVIDILNRMGHSISYHLTEEIETRLATEITERKQSTPDGLSMKPGLATGLAWDNFDQNTETVSGSGTVHDTVGICYQNMISENTEDNNSSNNNSDSTVPGTIAKKTKHTSRVFSTSQKSLEPYRKKPKMSKFDYVNKTCEKPANLTAVQWRDILWMMSLNMESAPLWTGWNALVTEDPLPLQQIKYMENISLPPTQLDVVAETLRTSQKVAEECGEQYAIVTYDLAIAKPALQIQAQDAPTYDNIFICFGAFHIALAYFGCLGYFLDGSGGPNILTECEVLAPGSLRGFLLGKHYNRCKRLHPLLAAAIQSLHFSVFLEKNEPILEDLREMIRELNTNMSPLVLETLEASPQYISLMSKYVAYCNETLGGKHGSTQKFWLMYVSLVQRFLIFNRACRTNDVPLFIYALEQMIPIFFAGNRPNYSRWMIRYHLNLLNAESTHPGVMKMLEDGAFSVRRTAKSFSRTAVDMTLEQTVNADAASRHTGMGSFVHSENARKRWMITMSIRSSIVSNLLLKAGLTAPEDVTKDLKTHRIARDHEDFQHIVKGIQSTMDPFIQEADDNLYCLTSGQRVAEPIKNDLLNFITKGETWSAEFREACFKDPSRFERPIPRRKLQNFASASLKSKIKSKEKVHEVQGTRDLFARLLLISTVEKIDLEKVLQFPLTPVPLSLAHPDGSRNTTDKAKLMHKLESFVKDPAMPTDIEASIVDATFFLHVQRQLPLTFGEIAKILLHQLIKMSHQVHLVCDVYHTPSIKDAERKKRGSEDLVFSITGPEQTRPKDWQSALKQSSFKVEFMRFLALEWMKSTYADIIGDHEVYLALDDTCYCFTVDDGCVSRVTVPALKSFHEEADTRIAFHLDFIAQVQEVKHISIRSNDTDVLVILLYYMSQTDTSVNVWLDAGLNSQNTRRFININELAEKLGSDVCTALPGLHALTGCDYTASFLNKGKIKPLELMLKHDGFKAALRSLGNGPLTDAIVQACEKFICHLYGKAKIASVNCVRFMMFQDTYTPKNFGDPLNSIKGINPSSMPPCAKVLRKKLERANYIAQMWKKASSQKPCDEPPDGHGWLLDDGTYAIHWYDADQLPVDIYRVLELNNDTSIVEEVEDEDVGYGENMYGADEANDEDDVI